MAVTVNPTGTLVTGIAPDYVVQLDIEDTVQYTESVNPVSLYINDVLVEPYVDVYYSSTSGSPRTRIRVDYVPPIPWEPSQYYNVSLIYRETEYNYTFRSTTSSYRNSDSITYLNPFSQKLANSFPEYSRVRQDEFSVGQQLLHPFANQLGTLFNNLWEHRLNNAIPSAQERQISELGDARFYQSYLPGYENLETVLRTKDLKGQDNLTLAAISETDENSLRNHYLFRTPDRLVGTRPENIGAINIASISLAHGINTQKYSFSKPIRLYLTVENAKELLSKHGIDILQPTTITVKGIDQFGSRIAEEFNFLSNTTILSKNAWSTILRVVVESDATSGTVLLSKAAPPLTVKNDPFEWAWPKSHPEGGPMIWKVIQDPDDQNYILQCCFRPSPLGTVEAMSASEVSNPGNFESPLNSLLYKEWILKDENNGKITVQDFAIDFNRPYIYILGKDVNNNQNIYIYHKYDEYPNINIKYVEQKDFECPLEIAEFDLFGDTLRDGVLDLKLTTKYSKSRKVAKYIWTVLLPDGSLKYILPNGNLGDTSAGAIIVNDFAEQFHIDPKIITLTLSDVGLYKFMLTTVYVDGVESIDTRYYNVRSKQPLFKYPVEYFYSTNKFIWATDQFYPTSQSDSRQCTFGWRPGRFSLVDSSSANQATCYIPSSITTSSLSFYVNNQAVSVSFGAIANDARLCTLSNFPTVTPDSTMTYKVSYSNSLDDEFRTFKVGEFTRIFITLNGELGLMTENGFQIFVTEKHDCGIFDETTNEFFTLVPYSRILVVE